MSGGALVARRIWIDCERSIQDACIAWNAAGRITRLSRAPAKLRGKRVDLVVFPSLVNAHAHLQLPALPPQAPRAFAAWAECVMLARAQQTARQLRTATRRAAVALLRDGVATIGEIDSIGSSAGVLRQLGVASRCYRELTGFHLDHAGARALLAERRPAAANNSAAGWSPHAPYSVSAALFEVVARTRLPLSIHCAELPEEQEFLRRGTGPFAALLRKLGKLPANYQAPGVGAVRYLHRLGVLRQPLHLVHCQELERGDLALLRSSGASIVVCPGTIAWFGRRTPPVARWLRAGIPVAIGTDSPASNAGWSLRADLAALAAAVPELSDRRLLAIGTRHGATALQLRTGALRIGQRADFVAVSVDRDDDAQPLHQFVRNQVPLRQIRLAGRRIVGHAGLA